MASIDLYYITQRPLLQMSRSQSRYNLKKEINRFYLGKTLRAYTIIELFFFSLSTYEKRF